MIENLKKILNEDQDPKAVEKISEKLTNILMGSEEVIYIAVQKKPALNVFPDSVVVTNKRIILCKPKNLGLSMDYIDYDFDAVEATFVKEGILGAEFTFSTKSNNTYTIDYLPKNQARKLYTYTREHLDKLKQQNSINNLEVDNNATLDTINFIENNEVTTQDVATEEIATEEVTNFAELITVNKKEEPFYENSNETPIEENNLSKLSKDELFEKLQNYKKLLDNGLILQGEYDKLKNEILKFL